MRARTGYWLLTICTMAALAARGGEEARERVPVELKTVTEWTELPPCADPVDGTVTRSAVRVQRAVMPATGQPAAGAPSARDLAQLRRSFRLEKREFLLGEPIPVEFQVALDGPGVWQEPIGGNYRARGRDDNFLFLMRHEDGTWVRDSYAPVTCYMGGLATTHKVVQGKPMSYWQPLQRWCAVERPGTYDLYCFQTAHGYEVVGRRAALLGALPEAVRRDHTLDEHCGLVETASNKPSTRYVLDTRVASTPADSPLVQHLPAEVLAKVAQEGQYWGVKQVADFARFRIIVREATVRERGAMVARWERLAGTEPGERAWPTSRLHAARTAICFSPQDCFLPLVSRWAQDPDRAPHGIYAGIAMNPSPAFTKLLFEAGTPRALWGLYYLHPDHIPDAIPRLIERLDDPDDEVRRTAEWWLHRWSGQAFQRGWEGSVQGRPTLAEGRRMQPQWQQWWAGHRDGFEPKRRR